MGGDFRNLTPEYKAYVREQLERAKDGRPVDGFFASQDLIDSLAAEDVEKTIPDYQSVTRDLARS